MVSGSESDNESPEVVSTSSMKTQREIEYRAIYNQRQKLKEELKLKRKLKTEKLANQKKEKLSKLQLPEAPEPEHDPNQLISFKKGKDSHTIAPGTLDKAPVGVSIPVDEADTEDNAVGVTEMTKEPKKDSVHRKIYPKFNVVVEPLTKLKNPRAASALSFREKRLAKVPRESVASALLSYSEKLRVKNT